MALRIEDYALIGDTHTVALVGTNRSIDWLCLPRFDAPTCFASLLGTGNKGCWDVTPRDAVVATRRRYRGPTLVLESEIETASGTVCLVDCMPPRKSHPRIVRVVEGLRGPSAPGVDGVRVWEVISRDRGHGWGDRRRRALMLAILSRSRSSPAASSTRSPVSSGRARSPTTTATWTGGAPPPCGTTTW